MFQMAQTGRRDRPDPRRPPARHRAARQETESGHRDGARCRAPRPGSAREYARR